MKDETLASMGKLLTKDMPRDAVHIACAPVIAAYRLAPGEHVGILPDGRVGRDTRSVQITSGAGGTAFNLGIIDPYLLHPVLEGDRCWLFLYPGSITSLKHLWTHPAFVPPYDGGEYTPTDAKAASEKWLRELADSIDKGYRDMMDYAKGVVEKQNDDDWHDYLTGGAEMESMSTPAEFWQHYEVVTGTKVPEKRRENFFSCSC